MSFHIRESVIREMTRLAEKYGAINLSQGMPSHDPPPGLFSYLEEAVKRGLNQYSFTWGLKELREELSRFVEKTRGVYFDPQDEVVITCGAAEGIIASLLALIEPEDKVGVIEPFYENYIPGILFARGKPYVIKLDSAFRIKLEKDIPSLKVFILNTPHNPTGRIWDDEELKELLELLNKMGSYLISDETYEFITYEKTHLSPLRKGFPDDKLIIVSSFSKFFSITGWRVGYILARRPIIEKIRSVHDYLTICAPTPFQYAISKALKNLPSTYFDYVRNTYRESRDILYNGLSELGFRVVKPEGAYYMMADFSRLSGEDSFNFARRLVEKAGVAVVPGQSFYLGGGETTVRFSFSLDKKSLLEAIERIKNFV